MSSARHALPMFAGCWRLLALIASASFGCASAPSGDTHPVAATASLEDEDAGDAPEPVPPAPVDEGAYQARVHEGAGVAFELGAGWKLSGEESSTLLAASPDGQAVLMFHIAEPDSLKQALAAIQTTLAAEVTQSYFGPPEEKKLGELTVEYASGAGKLEGRPVELGQLLVATPTHRVLIVVVVIEAGAPTSSKKQARHTLESIRPKPSLP